MIEVENLRKEYPPDILAVDDISFSVKEGEIFGFLGPNGAGKSTTIKILTTLLKKTAGKVTINGFDLDSDAHSIREIIGYSSQEVSVDDDLTARENLRMQGIYYHVPRLEIDQRVEELLETVDLMEAADRKLATFSGGMRKRLDLATALVSRPKLLFLDEPTTGLDPQSRKAVWEYIRSLNEDGMTIFLTTQYMEEADKLADRLCIIDQGEIVTEGSPKELKEEVGADLLELTFEEEIDNSVRAEVAFSLREIEGVQEVQECEDDKIECKKTIVLFGDNGAMLVPKVVRKLDRSDIKLKQLVVSPPSLDDVFLKFTGRKLKVDTSKPNRRKRWRS